MSILYVVSRFPKLSETFVVREWWKVAADPLFELRMAALLDGDTELVDPDSQRLLPHVLFVSLLSPRTIWANISLLLAHPHLYVRTLFAIVRGSAGADAGGVLKGAAIFWKSVRFARQVKSGGIDHLHAHFLHHPATAALVIHRLTGVPFTVTVHADDLFVGPALLHEKLAEATTIVTISEFNRSLLRGLAPAGKEIEVVHCGLDPAEFAFRQRDGLSRVICVARLVPKKGIDDLIRGLSHARRAVPNLTLDIIGAGTEEAALIALSRSLGLSDAVRFHGALPLPSVKEALSAADLFVLPARERPDGTLSDGRMDGIPVSLMEAMACGLPVVSTTVSGIPELVIDGVTGLLVAPDSPDEIGSAITRLVGDPGLARDLARRAREEIQASFDLQTETGKLRRLFSASVDGRASS